MIFFRRGGDVDEKDEKEEEEVEEEHIKKRWGREGSGWSGPG